MGGNQIFGLTNYSRGPSPSSPLKKMLISPFGDLDCDSSHKSGPLGLRWGKSHIESAHEQQYVAHAQLYS